MTAPDPAEGLPLIDWETPATTAARWPHKCERCGRFVKHDLMHQGRDHDGEYWASAFCAHCDRRVNVWPI